MSESYPVKKQSVVSITKQFAVADTLRYFTTMTGLFLTISLIAAFQVDACTVYPTGAVVFTRVQRMTLNSNRIKVLLPESQSEPTPPVSLDFSPGTLVQVPNHNIATRDMMFGDASPSSGQHLNSSPIRGPDA